MRIAKALLVWLLLAFAAPAGATTADAGDMVPAVTAGRVVTWPRLDGGAAGPMTVWVWLPPAYDRNPNRRFPVLYMHDGQNLFDRRLTLFDQAWGVDEAVARLAKTGMSRDWIVVGVQSPRARFDTLFPQKLFAFLPADFQQRIRTVDPGNPRAPPAGDAYLHFLVDGVKRRVDANFRTLPGRRDTAVMGSSMGGLMSFYAMGEYPGVFGQAACLSMHVTLASPTDPRIDHQVAAPAVAEAFRRYLATSRMRPDRNRLYLDRGDATLDASYPPYTDRLVPLLAHAGWAPPQFEFRVFPGAAHNETAWRARLAEPLAFLSRR